MVISHYCFSLWPPMSSQCCCWTLQPGSDFSRCTRSEQPRHSQGSEIERSGFLQRWNEIAFIVANLKHDKRTLSRLISVGFLVGCSTLMSPSLEAVTLKVSIFKTAVKLKKKVPSCQGRHASKWLGQYVRCSQYLSPAVSGADVNRASQQLVSHNQETAVTSKASSVVSTRWRLPPLSPTQRQFPCPLMQIGKWLPGRATCTQVDSSAKRLTMFWEPFSTFCQQLCRISPRFDPLTSSTPIKLSVSRVCKRI